MTKFFLPVSKQDMKERGWEQLDFIFVSGDAYVDHPSFAPAVIGRILEKYGYKIGIIAQPDWRSTYDFRKLGKPRLGFLVAAGNLDSMLNKFTAAKKTRSRDAYSPGGKSGKRPERATIVYCNRIREAWGDIPVIIGGVEASLRRFAHYDYWSDSVRKSILIDSNADLLVYGMGESQVKEIASQLAAGIDINQITMLQGICYKTASLEHLWDYLKLPDFETVLQNKHMFAEAFKTQYLEQDSIRGKTLVQKYAEAYIVQTPPAAALTTSELDEIYELPYQRTWHPSYDKDGGVPAIEEVKFSLVSHRGCFGSCSFCAITSHQGRIIQTRSQESVMREAETIVKLPDFKGYIHDIGGPSANFRMPSCSHQAIRGTCRNRQCLHPDICSQMNTSHGDYLELLRKLRSIPGVKKVFIRSGLRYDYLLASGDKEFLKELCQYHVSGQLKIAPEHVSRKVTDLMGKPGKEIYLSFMKAFTRMNELLGKEQYLVPYFMSSHPGAGLKEAVELAEFIRDLGYHPEQVQDFIPTPGSLSTCMYYTGIHPLTGNAVYVAKNPHEKSMQRALIQYRDPKNYALVHEALSKAGRRDLIGFGPKCLIKPLPEKTNNKSFPPKERKSSASRRQLPKRKRTG